MLVVNSDSNGGDGRGDRRRPVPALRSLMSEPRFQRAVGWIMLVVAAVAVVAAITGVVVAWRLLDSLDTATTDSLAVTVDALDSISDTIDVADGTVGATSAALTELQGTLSTLAASLDSGGDVVAATGQLTETAAPALADATVTLRQMQSLGEGIDGFLAAVANIPFTPDFDPEDGLGATFGRLADDLDPLDEDLIAAARSLETFEGSLDDLRVDVNALVVTIGEVNEELVAGEELLAGYREDVAGAREVALSSQSGLTQDQAALRWLVLLAGLAFAAAQVVPLWLGVTLLSASTPAPGAAAG